jgi:hypothetical protein
VAGVIPIEQEDRLPKQTVFVFQSAVCHTPLIAPKRNADMVQCEPLKNRCIFKRSLISQQAAPVDFPVSSAIMVVNINCCF